MQSYRSLILTLFMGVGVQNNLHFFTLGNYVDLSDLSEKYIHWPENNTNLSDILNW